MRRRQVFPWVLRLCLSGMLAAILHEFLAEGVGLGERPELIGFLPLLLSYLVGGLFPGRRAGWLLLLPACAGAVALRALVPGVPLSISPEMGLASLDAVLLFLLGRSQRKAWPSALGLPAVGLCLMTCAIRSWRGQDTVFPGLCGALMCLIRLPDMHREGLEAGLHNAPGEEPMPYPKGLRRKNWLLLALFLAVSLGFAAIPGLQNGADRLWGTAVSGTKEWTEGVAARLRENAEETPVPSPSPTPSPTPAPTPEPKPEKAPMRESDPPALRYGRILAVLLLAAALAYLWRKSGKSGFRLRELWERLKRLFREKEPEETYVDEVEKLRPWKSPTDPAREGVIARVRRARRRRVRLSDLPDDRTRIRFVYRELLRSPLRTRLRPAMTPSEVGTAVQSGPVRELVGSYNVARYAPGTARPGDAGRIAAAALKWVRSEGRKAVRERAWQESRAEPKKRGPAPDEAETGREVPAFHGAADMENEAVFPAAPLWLPFGDVGENIRCAARDSAAAREAAALAGLPEGLLRADPKTLTKERQWLVIIARYLAARPEGWEADLSALGAADAAYVSEALTGISDREGIRISIMGGKEHVDLIG